MRPLQQRRSGFRYESSSIGLPISSPKPARPRPISRRRVALCGSIVVSKLAWKLPGGDELFRDVAFRVGNGDRVALVGANGVGKSTLLKLITGDLDASEGTISVDGELG
jgi:ABC-type bacteriocin/lantibiotic exporter with double-glycine peptidase domain